MASIGNCCGCRLDLENRLLRATGNVFGHTELVRNLETSERASGAKDAICVCFFKACPWGRYQ
jgi:hypothetical protein